MHTAPQWQSQHHHRAQAARKSMVLTWRHSLSRHWWPAGLWGTRRLIRQLSPGCVLSRWQRAGWLQSWTWSRASPTDTELCTVAARVRDDPMGAQLRRRMCVHATQQLTASQSRPPSRAGVQHSALPPDTPVRVPESFPPAGCTLAACGASCKYLPHIVRRHAAAAARPFLLQLRWWMWCRRRRC